MNVIKGDLIELALNGEFDVIAHGCNCFCRMGAGIAVPFRQKFLAHLIPSEYVSTAGDYNKLGTIHWHNVRWDGEGVWIHNTIDELKQGVKEVVVVNCYTQYGYGSHHKYKSRIPLDYDALRLCMRKLQHEFPVEKVAVPLIGGGLAGGDKDTILNIIKEEFYNGNITVVLYDKI